MEGFIRSGPFYGIDGFLQRPGRVNFCPFVGMHCELRPRLGCSLSRHSTNVTWVGERFSEENAYAGLLYVGGEVSTFVEMAGVIQHLG